ncbi:hypothetical protein HN51_028039 [Arachis hypogaea]
MEEESSVQYLHFHPPHGSQDHSHVQTPPQDKKKERFDEKQSNDIENQKSKRKREMNEQSSFDWKIEEKMKSAPNENKTSGGKSDEENIIKGKGIEETPTEHDAALPLCNHLSSAAIVGQDGSVWAQSSNFPQFKPKEITAIMNDFAEP